MDTCNQSTLETLPDEILLEVCKYLLCNDILQSFVGLNYRMTQMITQYRHRVSLHKTSLSKFHYLRINVFPQISFQIRSLVIDCCHSVLQGDLFLEHFGKRMSMIFPRLERISLVSYLHHQLLAFLSTLHDLDYLVEFRLYNCFQVPELFQPTVVRSLFQANNHRLTTILMDDKSSSLSFNVSDCHLNITRLSIKLKTLVNLPCLFATVPNVQHLDIIIEASDPWFEKVDEMKLSSLFHLTNLRLKSTKRSWKLEELSILLVHLPTVRQLSLFLSTYDRRLTQGNLILSSLPSTVQQFSYAICLLSATTLDRDGTITASWPSSHPVAYFVVDGILCIHTLPWTFTHIKISSLIDKIVSCDADSGMGDFRQVEQLDLSIDRNFTLENCSAVISQCRRVREITIYAKNVDDSVKEEQFRPSYCSKLSRLNRIYFCGSLPFDVNHFSFIVNAAPNLLRLDLPFNYLLKLLEDQKVCHLVGQRIISLCIFGNVFDSSCVTLNEEHISSIASIFSRVRDIYIDLIHLPRGTTTASKEDILDDPSVSNVSNQLCQQKYEIISPGTVESMLLRVLIEFKEHRLIGLCIDGRYLEGINTDAEQWLRDNTVLCDQPF